MLSLKACIPIPQSRKNSRSSMAHDLKTFLHRSLVDTLNRKCNHCRSLMHLNHYGNLQSENPTRWHCKVLLHQNRPLFHPIFEVDYGELEEMNKSEIMVEDHQKMVASKLDVTIHEDPSNRVMIGANMNNIAKQKRKEIQEERRARSETVNADPGSPQARSRTPRTGSSNRSQHSGGRKTPPEELQNLSSCKAKLPLQTQSSERIMLNARNEQPKQTRSQSSSSLAPSKISDKKSAVREKSRTSSNPPRTVAPVACLSMNGSVQDKAK